MGLASSIIAKSTLFAAPAAAGGAGDAVAALIALLGRETRNRNLRELEAGYTPLYRPPVSDE